MGLSAPAAEKLAITERQATWVRLGLVAFAGAAYVLLLDPEGTRPGVAYATLALAGVYSTVLLAWEPYREAPVEAGIATSVIDLLLVGAWIAATGGYGSPFYLILYLSLTALALRYGPGEALVGAVSYALVYLAILGAGGAVQTHPVGSTVRVGFLFLFAGFGGLVSRAMLDQAVAKHDGETLAEDLEHALSLQRATLDATADGVLVTDLEGNLQTFNERFRRMWSLPDGLMVQDDGLAFQCALPDLEDPERFTARLEELYEDPEASGFDAVFFQDGRILERYSCPQRLDGEIVGRVFSFRDVTDRLRSRERLENYAIELEQRNEDLKQFAHAVSHDLQEPLRVISNFLELIEDRHGEAMVPQARDFVRVAARSADRMENLIEDLLAYARLDHEAPEPGPVDAGAALDQALTNLEIPVRESGARVCTDALPTVQANTRQLVRLFQNLLHNAIKYSGEGPPQIEVEARPHEQGYLFSVSDDGPGIPEDEHASVFTVFRRLARDRDAHGTGMGLAICKRIVERHGGRIWIADDEHGRGATVCFTLPGSPVGPAWSSDASLRANQAPASA